MSGSRRSSLAARPHSALHMNEGRGEGEVWVDGREAENGGGTWFETGNIGQETERKERCVY